MTKSCPECKSMNTRQMDPSFGNRAYCLSCYHQFQSLVKHSHEAKARVSSLETKKYINKLMSDVKFLKSKIDNIEMELQKVINGAGI